MSLTNGFKLPKFRYSVLAAMLIAGLLSVGCRRDMQDQPRYEPYEDSDFFRDGIASRNPPKNTVPREFLRDDAHFYAGKLQNASQARGQAGARGSQQGAGSANQSGRQQSGGDTRQTGGLPPVVSADTQRPSDNPQPTGSSAMQTPAQFNAELVTTFPFAITKRDLDEGQRWFEGMCSMCHGMTGIGDGMVVRRGYRKPPSLHEDRLRGAPVGHFFDVITNGWGSMPSYGAQVNPEVRWKIIAYIRALQLTQQGTLDDVPPAERAKLTAGGGHAQR